MGNLTRSNIGARQNTDVCEYCCDAYWYRRYAVQYLHHAEMIFRHQKRPLKSFGELSRSSLIINY